MSGYPAVLTIPDDNKVANWRPLLHWLMVVPHLVVGYVLLIVSEILGVLSWLIIVFTGKLPAGLANFQIMILRYGARMMGFYFGLTEQYPPFSFDSVADDPGDHPIRVSVRPQLDGRNRLTVLIRILMLIPLVVVAVVFEFIAAVIGLLAWFAVLFTGRYPTGMRDFMIGIGRYFVRYYAYALLLTDEYPPFNINE